MRRTVPGSGGGVGAVAQALAARLPLARTLARLGAPFAAALSVAVVLGGGPGWLAVLGWLVAGAAVIDDVVHQRTGVASGFGRQVPSRLLMLVAAGAGAAEHSPAQRTGIWVGVFIVAATVLVEPVLVRALPRREVAQLPGFADAPGAALVAGLAPGTTAVLAVAGLLGVSSVAPAVRGVLPVLALLVLGVGEAVGVQNARDRAGRRARLKLALERYGPRFAVYTGREDGGAYQVSMWLPYLERLALPYLIVTRRPSAVTALTRITSAPVVARGSWRDLDDVVVPSLGAAFYVNSVASNSNFVSYRGLTHVYLGHGDSDKPLSYHPAHAMYDQVFVAGAAAVDRYARNGVSMRPDAFVIVGRPQLAALHTAAARRDPPAVLYAPTWAGYNSESTHSSLPRGVEIVRTLLARGVVVIFRPHPFSRTRAGERAHTAAVDALLRDDAARTGRPHRWGPAVDAVSFIDSANESDALVSDVSSVLVDYLGADKPMAVLAIGAADDESFLARYPVARGGYLVRADLADLGAQLELMLGPDPGRAARTATRDYYLGGLDGSGAVAAFTAAAGRAIARRTVADAD